MMSRLTWTKTVAFWFCVFVLFLQISVSCGQKLTEEELAQIAKEENQEKKKEEEAIPQDLGTGVHDEKDLMDICENAAGPRPLNEVFSPGRTNYATVDDVNGGFCGVNINTPGIWWWVEGTGDKVRVSTCHLQTDIAVKFSVFTGSCSDLQCVTGGAEPDFECPILQQQNSLGEWNSLARSITFPTKLGQNYYVLVQQDAGFGRGTIWLNFRPPNVPQNNDCPDAIGPVPRDMTMIENTSVDATVSKGHETCGGEDVPSLYPGTWFQIMGTGDPVTIMACSKFNFDGFAFYVYNGAYCNSKDCVEGQYEVNVEDEDRCTFGSGQVTRPMTKYTFDTHDRDRYWIYVHFARTRAETPTADFRFYVDDGKGGENGSSGAHMIEVVDITAESDGRDDNDRKKKKEESSGDIARYQSAGISLFVLTVSWIIQECGYL